jgi:hypothetical protein
MAAIAILYDRMVLSCSQEEDKSGLVFVFLFGPIVYKDQEHYFYYVNHKPKYLESRSSCAIYCPKVPA